MFDHALSSAERRNEMLEQSLQMERERLREEDSQRAQERVDLATNAAQGVQALTERMMSDESTRAQRSMQMQNEQSQTLVTTLTSIFSQQQSMMQQSTEQQRRADEFRLEQERQRADRERRESADKIRHQQQEWEGKRIADRDESTHKLKMEREEAQRRYEQHRLELETKLQREREEMERKDRRDKEEAERRERWMMEERTRREEKLREESREREGERARQHERILKDAEMSSLRDREHAERMMQLSKIEMESRAKSGGMDILGNAAGMLAQFGIEPSEILPRLFKAEEEDKASWMDALPSLLGVAAEVAKAGMGAKEAASRAKVQELEVANRRALTAPAPVFDQAPRQEMFAAPPESAPPTEEDGQEEVEAAPPTISQRAAKGGVPLKAQKDARVELRKLVRSLMNSEPDKWQGLVMQALQNELAIFHYIKAVSVHSALLEAGADDALADAICSAMSQSAMIPDDVPLKESDL